MNVKELLIVGTKSILSANVMQIHAVSVGLREGK
jgi:hypothetical protein